MIYHHALFVIERDDKTESLHIKNVQIVCINDKTNNLFSDKSSVLSDRLEPANSIENQSALRCDQYDQSGGRVYAV